MKLKTKLAALALAFGAAAPSLYAQNLLVNGDFSSGNTGFSSDYSYVASGASAVPGTYGIRSSSQDFNSNYASFGDHTSGSGLMMLVDGASSNLLVWSETVNVISNTAYQFSGWAISSDSANPAQLQVQINGVQATNFTLPTSTTWVNFSSVWYASTNSTAAIAIYDVNPAPLTSGDDFALDDLSLTGTPDLTPVSVGWSGQPVAGQNLTVTMAVSNVGSGFVNQGWYDAVVLSTNTTLAGEVPNGLMEISANQHNLSPGQGYAETNTITLPSVPAGSYYLLGYVDDRNLVYEAGKANNVLAANITVSTPDLAPASVGWSGQPVAGQSLTVTMAVSNVGSGFVNQGWYDAVVLSTNTTLAGEVPNGLMEISANQHNLSPGQGYAETNTITLPSVPAGSYYLLGYVDDRNLVYEAGKANNVLAANITVSTPDLTPASVGWSGQPVAGQSLTVTMAVSNVGSGFVNQGWYDAVVLSTNTTLAGEVPNGLMEISANQHNLSPGQGYAETNTITLPSVPAGSYYLLGYVDDRNLVYEAGKANNVLAANITVSTPDLAPASVGWSGQPVAGQSLTVTMAVSNVGSGFVNQGWYDAVVLSTNTTLAGEVPNGLMEISANQHNLSPGQGYAETNTITLPSVPAGSYYLLGYVDDRNLVYEAGKANNVLAANITVSTPDLTPASVGWSGQPVAGQSLTVTMAVSNVGSGFVNQGWYDAVVLSTNTTLAGEVPNGLMEISANQHNLSPGQGYAETNTITLPSVPAGSYYLLGYVDDRNLVYEAGKANNVLAANITVSTPDLAPASVGWSGQPVAGQSLTVTMAVSNVGSGFVNQGWYDAVVLSTNTTLAGEVPNGLMEISANQHSLSPGQGYAETNTITLPNVLAGSYYLIGYADDRNLVYEASKTNNTWPVAITIGNADLVASNLTLIGPAIAGTNLWVSFTVINIASNAYSSYWYDGVTLSTNATLAGAITNWDWYGYHATTSGGSYVENQAILLPRVAAGTNYYLIAQADDRNYVPEPNKTNNLQVLQITMTNRPPSITLLAPTNLVQATSCVPVLFTVSAGVQLGSYAITNVQFFDGATPIGQSTSSPYRTQSGPFEHGLHTITAQAADQFGLMATSSVATLSVQWPAQTNVLRADIWGSNCVVCMAALNGSNYVVQVSTNLQSSLGWQPLLTNTITQGLLVVTNLRNAPFKFYRSVLLP